MCCLISGVFGQVNIIKDKLSRCNASSIEAGEEISFPWIDGQLALPSGWSGEFIGEIPNLKAWKIIENDTIWLWVANPWNPDSRAGLDSILCSWHPDHTHLMIEDRSFLLYYNNERDRYQLLFHTDESEEYENRWTWDFYLNKKAMDERNVYACEVKSIIVQFVKAYKVETD